MLLVYRVNKSVKWTTEFQSLVYLKTVVCGQNDKKIIFKLKQNKLTLYNMYGN